MDLSKLSDADLMSLKSGDLSKVSDAGLMALKASPADKPMPAGFPRDVQPAMPSGAQLLAANPVTRMVTGAASPFLGLAQLGARNPIGKALGQDKWIDDKIKTLEDMQKAGGHEGFDLMGLLGQVLGPASLAAMKAPLAATMGGKVAQGAAIGAGFGATSPVADTENFASQKAQQIGTGAAVGAVIPPAISGVVAGAKATRNLVDPVLPGGIDRLIARTANKAAGGKRDDVIALLNQNRQIVPGSQAGAGEVAAPAGSAEFSALQRLVEPLKPTAYRDMGQTQDAARVAALRTVGQDKGALDAAIQERARNAAEGYGAVRGNLISPQSDTEIMQAAIAQRAAGKADALQTQGRYQTVAAQQGELAHGRGPTLSPVQTLNEPQMNVGATGRQVRSPTAYPVEGQPRIPGRYTSNIERVPEAQAAAGDAGNVVAQKAREQAFLETTMDLLKQTVGMGEKNLNTLLNRPSMREAVKDAMQSAQETGSYFPKQAGEKFTVQNLQRIKESLDAGILAAKKSVDAGKRPELSPVELEGTKRAFVKWLSEKSPGWDKARAQYAADSTPINQMQVGQYLENKLVPALNDTGATAGQRGAMYAQAVRDAPGTIKRATGSPRFDAIEEVLTPSQAGTVKAVGEDLGRKAQYEDLGQKGIEAARDLVGQMSPKIPAAGMFNPKYSVAKAIINRLSGKISGKALDALAVRMQDPKAMAQVMSQMPPADRLAIIEELLQQGGRAGIAGLPQ